MPRAAKKSEEASTQTGTEAMADLISQNTFAVTAFMEATQNMLRGAMAFNEELMSFANKRLQHNIETGQSLTSCHDPADAYRLQVEYGRSAAEQYFEEANRIMSLATQVARDSWTPIETQAQTTVENMTKKIT